MVWSRSWAHDACIRAGGSAVFLKENMADEDSYSTDSSVSCEEGHSTILLVHTRFFTRF